MAIHSNIPTWRIAWTEEPGGLQPIGLHCLVAQMVMNLPPGLGRSPGKGNGNPLQHSCLENPMNRGAWRAMVHRVTKSPTQLKDFMHTHRKGKVV